ncbi:MAG: hypothetical protein IPN95_23445 [Bacteroidetes bacterium]|nr:hypothetical protein [Bacteroidota bacterium]
MRRERHPRSFLKKHQKELADHNPAFAQQLAESAPLEKVIWDPGLEAQCREHLDKGTLDPAYKGTNDLCGESSGMHGIGGAFEAMDVVADFHTNILDPNCKYLGIAFSKNNDTYWYSWGYRCDRVKVAFTFEGKVDTSKVDFAALNTAKNATYLSDVEKQMVLEVNFARAYPKGLRADHRSIRRQAASWSGLEHDDYIAGKELMAMLNSMGPLSILQPKQCVYEAAKMHGLDCEKRGFLDHTGSDGSAPWDRILKKCTELSYGNENLRGSGTPDPRDAVIALLIDGGISNRGHRHNMLDLNVEIYRLLPDFRQADENGDHIQLGAKFGLR